MICTIRRGEQCDDPSGKVRKKRSFEKKAKNKLTVFRKKCYSLLENLKLHNNLALRLWLLMLLLGVKTTAVEAAGKPTRLGMSESPKACHMDEIQTPVSEKPEEAVFSLYNGNAWVGEQLQVQFSSSHRNSYVKTSPNDSDGVKQWIIWC